MPCARRAQLRELGLHHGLGDLYSLANQFAMAMPMHVADYLDGANMAGVLLPCLPTANDANGNVPRTQQAWRVPCTVGAQAQLGRISPKWENKIWVQTGDSLPNGRTLFHKALCRLRGTFAGDKSMFNGFLGSNYPNSPSTSKFHRLLLSNWRFVVFFRASA